MPRKPSEPATPADGPVPPETAAAPTAPDPGAAPTEPVPTHDSPAAPTPPSLLDRVRDNRVGPLGAGLLVALAVALLLAVLVPERPHLYAFTVLGLLLTLAVGFTVRYVSRDHGVRGQATAFVATVIGIHVMSTTGALDGVGGGAASGLLARIGFDGIGFDDALLASLATPALSTGGVLSGLAAAIIVGWGPRREDAEHR